MLDFLTALFLGFVEGLTEFIPVSSTGHLILLIDGLNFPAPAGHVFEVFIQLGAILAIVVLYRRRLLQTALTLHSNPQSRHFLAILIIGTIPALIVGGLFHGFIKTYLYNPAVIGVSLIIGGLIILFLEKKWMKAHPLKIATVDEISRKKALLIGGFQTIALIPGVSRSGATIMGSLALGLTRKAAAEFSFFLAIPVMFCAVAYDFYKNYEAILAYPRPELMAGGFAAAFITAMIVVRFVLAFIERFGFAPFAWYRIGLGLLVLAFMI